MSEHEKTSTRSSFSARSGRRPFDAVRNPIHLGFLVAAILLGVLFAESYQTLVMTWMRSGMFQFQLLIPPICVLLVWSHRRQLATLTAEPRRLGLLAVAVIAFGWLLGALADVDLVKDFAVIAVVPMLVYSFYGPRIARQLLFPLGYLFFAVPVGQFMVGPMQQVTAQISVYLLEITGVPVLLSGNYITTPAALWHVAEACSGIKFFLATTAFGALYSYLFFNSLRRRLIFVACSLVVPIIANGLRVYFTILIGETFGVQYASGTDHMIFGWQFFGTVLVLLFLAGWPWHEPPLESGPADKSPGASPTTPRVAQLLCIAIVVIAFAPAWLAVSRGLTASPVFAKPAAPTALDGMARRHVGHGPNPGMRFVDPDWQRVDYYGDGRKTMRLDYVTYAGADHGGGELLTMRNRLFDPGHFEAARHGRVAASGQHPAFTTLGLKSRNGHGRWWLSYTYRVGSHWTTSPVVVKAWQTINGLLFMPAPVSAVILSSPAKNGQDNTRFTQAMTHVLTGLASGGSS